MWLNKKKILSHLFHLEIRFIIYLKIIFIIIMQLLKRDSIIQLQICKSKIILIIHMSPANTWILGLY